MDLVCTHEFGNFKPGDTVAVPDGALFDGSYFDKAAVADADVKSATDDKTKDNK